jgi:uncharacterized membrane protein YphA (DoxX/SURF4 family)
MALPIAARHIPVRLAAGAYILNSGLGKWRVEEEQAKGLHGMASGAFPFLGAVPATRFQRMLAAGEIAIGAALLAPFVPTAVAGAALTGFSAGLVALYLRTPFLRQPGSIRPSEAGIGVSKDIWLLGIGTSLLIDAADTLRTSRR